MNMNRLQQNIEEAVTALTERPMLAADAERILIAHDLMQGNLGSPSPYALPMPYPPFWIGFPCRWKTGISSPAVRYSGN